MRVASMTSGRQRVLSDTLLSVSRAYSAPPLSRSHMSWALCSVFRCWHVGFVTAKHRVGCISAGVVAVSGFNLESLSMMNHHHRFESCNRESGARGRRATLPPYQPAPAPTALSHHLSRQETPGHAHQPAQARQSTSATARALTAAAISSPVAKARSSSMMSPAHACCGGRRWSTPRRIQSPTSATAATG